MVARTGGGYITIDDYMKTHAEPFTSVTQSTTDSRSRTKTQGIRLTNTEGFIIHYQYMILLD